MDRKTKLIIRVLAIVPAVFLIAYLWEFAIEDYVVSVSNKIDKTTLENIGLKWEFVFTSTIFSAVAIAGPAYLLVKQDKIQEAIENSLVEALANEKNRAKESRLNEAKYRAVTESAQDAIISADKEGMITQWNMGARNIFGYEDAEIIGQPVTVLMPERFREDHERGFKHLMAGGERRFSDQRVEVYALGKNGKEFPVELTLSDWKIGDEIFVTSIIRSTAEQRRQQDIILKMSHALEQSPSMIFITNTEGDIEYVNQMFTKLSGYTAEETIGKNPNILQSGETPSDVYADLWRTIKSSQEWRGELKDRRKDGSMFWVSATISPIKNTEGVITNFVCMHEDITHRKSVEERERQARLQAEIANRAKSELLANMSHELRTPLNAIIGFSQAFQGELYGPLGNNKYVEYADDINQSGNHLLDLINDILDMSAIEAGKLELHEAELSLDRVVTSSMRIITPRANSGRVSLSSDIPSDIPNIYADERRLKQILLNLLSNAVKFTQEGGSVTVSASVCEKNGIVIVVRDTGIGMDEEEISKAMSEFGQVDSGLDRRKEGTGLGLPLTKSLIELHGGKFSIDSEKGVGTTVTVRFPSERVVSGA